MHHVHIHIHIEHCVHWAPSEMERHNHCAHGWVCVRIHTDGIRLKLFPWINVLFTWLQGSLRAALCWPCKTLASTTRLPQKPHWLYIIVVHSSLFFAMGTGLANRPTIVSMQCDLVAGSCILIGLSIRDPNFAQISLLSSSHPLSLGVEVW